MRIAAKPPLWIKFSGFNMAIVAGLFASLFGRELGRRGGAVAGISVYTILVGANAAVVRAAIMSGLAFFARQGRAPPGWAEFPGFAGSGLDWLVVAAPGEEHIAALPRLVERFPPERAL